MGMLDHGVSPPRIYGNFSRDTVMMINQRILGIGGVRYFQTNSNLSFLAKWGLNIGNTMFNIVEPKVCIWMGNMLTTNPRGIPILYPTSPQVLLFCCGTCWCRSGDLGSVTVLVSHGSTRRTIHLLQITSLVLARTKSCSPKIASCSNASKDQRRSSQQPDDPVGCFKS